MAMHLARLLLPIDQHGTTDACVASAVTLAQRFGVVLEVLYPCPPPWQRLPYSSELSPYAVQELIEVERKQAAAERRSAKKWCQKQAKAHAKVRVEFAAAEGLVTQVVAGHARLADFSVVPSRTEGEGTFWEDVRDGALFDSGRPMLVVPPGAACRPTGTVVIGWKDRPEAVRAIAAAAPFLGKAKRVRLVAVAEEDQADPSLEAMADYLAQAGLKVRPSRIPQNGRDAGEALVEEASKEKDVLLVMGAFGHGRLRERVFGGATQSVLRNTTVPVLMMH
jgi:nucleotide-binding universal stress UspA family protein